MLPTDKFAMSSKMFRKFNSLHIDFSISKFIKKKKNEKLLIWPHNRFNPVQVVVDSRVNGRNAGIATIGMTE
jgi:hypothetical protein